MEGEDVFDKPGYGAFTATVRRGAGGVQTTREREVVEHCTNINQKENVGFFQLEENLGGFLRGLHTHTHTQHAAALRAGPGPLPARDGREKDHRRRWGGRESSWPPPPG